MPRRTCYYSGHVQGVGFRYTVRHLAERHAVGGYVRNLPDGRVEMVVEGPAAEMDRLAAEIEQQMGSFIDDVSTQESPGSGEFSEFTIRH